MKSFYKPCNIRSLKRINYTRVLLFADVKSTQASFVAQGSTKDITD
jgi:hypothetical protein